MNFTDSPFENMMQRVPPAPRPEMQPALQGSRCRSCSYWRGVACVGICYRDFMQLRKGVGTSGQIGPKLAI